MAKPLKKPPISTGKSFKQGIAEAYDRLKDLTLRGADTTSVDSRLTYGQMHSMVVDTLGMEPLDFVTMLLSMSMVANSRVTIAPGESARLALMVHDRLYPMPDGKARAKAAGDNQFSLEFAWQDNTDDNAPGEGNVIDMEAAE